MQQRQRASAVSDVIASQAERQRKRNESSRTMKMKSKKEMVTKITSRTVSTFQTQSQRRLRLQQKQMYRPTLRRGVPTNTNKIITGKLANTRPDDLIATLIKDVVTKTNIDPKLIDDVIIGCATPEAQQGLNIARLSLLLAGLPNSVPGLTMNRFCASGLESIATAAAKIKAGQAEFILAGGVESMSLLPFGGHNICPNPKVFANNGEHKSISYSMGITAECVAEKYNISRQIQDEFALHSHHKALVAQEMDIFAQEITPELVGRANLEGTRSSLDLEVSRIGQIQGSLGRPHWSSIAHGRLLGH